MAKGAILHDADSLTVTVPMTFTKRGGRKLVLAPSGVDMWAMPRARVDNTMVKAVARAHRWKRMLDSGDYPTVQDLANAEKINSSYVARVLRLSLLAPDIVEAILDGRQPTELQLEDLLVPLPVEWSAQERHFGSVAARSRG